MEFLLELLVLLTMTWLVSLQKNNPETKSVQQKNHETNYLIETGVGKQLITETSEPRKPRCGNTTNPLKSDFEKNMNMYSI